VEIALQHGSRIGVAPRARVRIEAEGAAPGAAELGGGNRDLRTRGLISIGIVVAADQTCRAEQRQRELAPVDELVLRRMLEQERHPARVDEPMSRVGRERHLAVTSFRRSASLHDSELTFGEGAFRRPRKRHVETQPMVRRRVLERDAQADERLSHAQLDRRRHVDRRRVLASDRGRGVKAARPTIGADDGELSDDRSGCTDLDGD
jgi:hypothetical protein